MTEPPLPVNVEDELAFLELAMRAQGFTPDTEALARVRRMLAGELTRDEARSEVFRKYNSAPPGDSAS